VTKVRTWVGLDVYAATVVACVVDAESGEMIVQRLSGDTSEVVRFGAALPGPTRVAYEAGPTGFGLAQVKTDRRDAERLVRLLMINALHPVRHRQAAVLAWDRHADRGRTGRRDSRLRAVRAPQAAGGRFRVSRAFTDALGRALNPCKQPQAGLYIRGARFALVLDLVDAEWTRCTPLSVFRISRADTGPGRAGGGGPPGPPDAV
jgi:transposase